MTGTLVLIALCILGSAMFSGSEIALITISRVRLKHWVEKRFRGASLAEDYLEKPYRMINTILVGNNLVNIAASVLTAKLLLDLYPATGDNPIISAFVVPALVAPPLLLFGEIIPKALFRQSASRVFPYLARPLKISTILLTPLLWFTNGISRVLLNVTGTSQEKSKTFFTRRNIELLLRESERVGIVQESEREIITGVFTFGETSVREVMTPRTEIVAVQSGTEVTEVVTKAIESGFSRLPLYEENIDRIIGMYHIFDLLKYDESVGLTMRPVHVVPDTKKCDELLYEMRAERRHLAVVVDEYGGTAGIVTLEDLVEELVGDIQDEYDREEVTIRVRSGQELIVEGATEIEEVNELLGLELDSGEVETMGGLFVSRLGRIPDTGEVFRMGNLRIEILRANDIAVEKMRVTLVDDTSVDKVQPARTREYE
jgi:putative hemolysin